MAIHQTSINVLLFSIRDDATVYRDFIVDVSSCIQILFYTCWVIKSYEHKHWESCVYLRYNDR